MSEFKNALAVTTVSAAVAIGSFVASQEMSANYHEAENNCDAQPAPELVNKCHDRLEGDESGVLEVLGYFGLLATLAGGFRTYGAIGNKQ
jgi:hypothetical protein